MNPDTNELVRVDNRKLKNILRRGFIPIPKKLHKAADLALGKKDSVIISKTSGGKLSKWAAKKRKERAERKKMVDDCNNYYMNLKRMK